MQPRVMICFFSAALFQSSLIAAFAAPAPAEKNFRAELVVPGKTSAEELKGLLGKPMRLVREGASREYYFYDLGAGSSMDATVAVHKGVVEYVSYLCTDSMKDVKQKFEKEPSMLRTIDTGERGRAGSYNQIIFESKAKGYVYDQRSQKVRACISWAPTKKFDELGK